MFRKNVLLPVFGSRNFSRSFGIAILLVLTGFASGCDRGAATQIEAARNFADAVARNEGPRRDSMIATYKFLDFFKNSYVSSDMLSWFRTFYDYQHKRFIVGASADVDQRIDSLLMGGLRDTAAIVETGMVKVKSPNAGEDPAFFWMVHQRGKPWQVAMVTKGEAMVNFQ